MTTQNKLPISVDVSVSLSKAQSAVGADMTIIAFCTNNVDFLHGERVQLFSTQSAFNEICTAGDSVWWAGNAFFSKAKRPNTIAVCKIFESNQPAYLLGGTVALSGISSVADGAFKITIDGTEREISDMDFSSATGLSDIASIVNTALSTYGSCSVRDDVLCIKSAATGSTATISFASAPESGTDVSSILGLTEADGAMAMDGYTSGNIAQELQKIADYVVSSGKFLYGWVLDREYRDTEAQALAAQWVNSRGFDACGAFCTNNANAYNPQNTTNNGYIATTNGYTAVNFTYDDNSQVYPELSYLANFLAVNYSGTNTTISGKFKDADGIAAVNFPNIETNVAALEGRRINTLTGIVGQTIKYFREGVQSSSLWTTDGWVNVCNFINDLRIEILNVFLRNNKVAYTVNGQNLLIAAASKVCNKYKTHGSFADRIEEDKSTDSGYSIVPACQIEIQDLGATTAAQRAAHIGTPLTITVNDSGWMGSIAINVNVTD